MQVTQLRDWGIQDPIRTVGEKLIRQFLHSLAALRKAA
jgi:hypothetical protein